MTKQDTSGQEPGRFSTPKRRDLFLNEYLANTNEERQDVIFRRVRGILNKITPETFDKLSKDLVNVGLDSPRTLRGLIYLLFDKALKDLKYSSLYAKLCQKLSERSPNFEKEPGPNTFCKFLISKCEDEFERRRKATEDFECKKELTDEEFEQKVIAKQKMLGNIKFICELGKKRLLQEEILHECIRGLLSRKKERPLQDQAQDLECLCQIMRTIGSLLDIETSKNLMNQYFERIDMYSRKQELPSRIRFMLRDVIDLRNNNWRPRPFQREDNVPQPLSKLREEAGFNNAASNAPIDKLGNTKNLMNINNLSRLNASKLSSLLIDDDEPGYTTTTDFHWGSTAFLPHANEFDIFSSNTYTNQGEMSQATPVVNPIKSQGSSTNASNPLSESSSTVSFKTNSRFQGSTTAPSSGPIAPRFLQTSRYESFVGSGQNNFDTFLHSYSTNDGARIGHDRESAVSNLNDPMPPSKRNDHTNVRHNVAPARGYDKRFLARDTHSASQSQTPFANSFSTHVKPTCDIDANAAISQQSVRDEHLRCNNNVRNTAPQLHNHHQQQQQQQQHRHHPKNTNPHDDVQLPRSSYIDSPRPLPQSRTNDNSLSSRNTFAPRNQHASDMPPPPLPPPLSQSQSPPPSASLPSVTHQTRSNEFKQHPDLVMDTNLPIHRHNQGAPPPPQPTNGNMRPRRFDRGGRDRGHEHEQRQPKFSGANYRLPGRDRPPPQIANRNANQQPESELNLNWRSADTTRPKQQPGSNDLVESQPASQTTLGPRQKQADVSDYPTKQMTESKQHMLAGDDEVANMLEASKAGNFGSGDSNAKRSVPTRLHHNVGFEKPGMPNQTDHFNPDLHSRRTPSPHQVKRVAPPEPRHHANRDYPPPRFSNNNLNYGRAIDNVNTESNSIHNSRHRRSNQNGSDFRAPNPTEQTNHQQHNPIPQNHRNEHHERIGMQERRDFKDRDEQQHRRASSPPQQHSGMRHDNDHRQSHQTRLNDARDIGHDRKMVNQRPPAMGRNQSFEGHNSLDFKRGPNWRNDNSGPGNNLSTKKDVLPAQPSIVSAHHQMLSRPPVRMSETDFSLRPSHNLVGGRTVTEPNPKPAERNADVVHENTGSANQQDVKSSTRPLVDLSARQIFASKESTETTAQTSESSKSKTTGRSDNMNQSMNKFMSILKDYLKENSPDTSKLNSKLKDLKLPKELQEECLVNAMKHTIVKSEPDREKTSKLFSHLIPAIFETSALLNAFKTIFEQMKGLEVETPKVKSLVAGLLSRAVVDNLLTIEEVAQVLIGGKHHPLFLLFLQKLEKSAGQAWLCEKFVDSKINLMNMLPEVDRSKDRLASALKDRCLGFLDPMLTIEPDLWAQMRDRDPSPAAVYRWIKENVDQTIQNTPTFAQVFISCLLKYIHNATSERFNNNNNNNSSNNNNNQQQQQQNKDSDSSDSNKSSPTNSSSQGINDHEKELLSKYQQMMHAILKDKQMQLATLYALQSFYHGLNFPKGALLRWFHMLYDLSIVDDDVFFIWKEEINDKVPGKGQALFQVNTWLNWLAEPDSEEEEE